MMNKNRISVTVVFLTCFTGFSEAQKLSPFILSIPDSLIERASSVVMYENRELEIFSEERAVLNVYRDVLVMNEAGIEAGFFYEHYDHFRSLEDIQVGLFDQSGNKIRLYIKKDMENVSTGVDETLVEDDRAYILRARSNEFPYHVVMRYQVTLKGFVSLPDWYPQEEDQSVLNARFTLNVPAGYTLNYRMKNFQSDPEKTSGESGDQYTWVLKNIPALQVEDFGPSGLQQSVSLSIVPSKFSFDGKEGSNQSWQSFGAWYYDLYKDRQNLPDDMNEKVAGIITGESDPVLKVKKLYEFMQRNTHYFAVQLGLGGWQPAAASFVAKNGFGDCKALSNYMHSLLQATAINSYPALVYSGYRESDIDVSLPSNQFNHVILMVPLQSDTIWLECTNPDAPFNFLSGFTENRHVLAVGSEGGEIVKTPSTKPSQNLIAYHFSINLADPKNANANISIRYTGNEALRYHSSLFQFSDDKKLDALREVTGLPNFNVSSFQYLPFNRDSVSGEVKITASFPEYSQVSSSRIFFSPFIIPVWSRQIQQEGKRKFPLMFSYPYFNSFTGEFLMPEGYHVESMPKDLKMENEYLKYETHFVQNAKSILAEYSITIRKPEIPAAEFEAFSSAISQILSDQKKKIVLAKNRP